MSISEYLFSTLKYDESARSTGCRKRHENTVVEQLDQQLKQVFLSIRQDLSKHSEVGTSTGGWFVESFVGTQPSTMGLFP